MSVGLIVIEPEHLRLAAGRLTSIGERQATLAAGLRRLSPSPLTWPLGVEIDAVAGCLARLADDLQGLARELLARARRAEESQRPEAWAPRLLATAPPPPPASHELGHLRDRLLQLLGTAASRMPAEELELACVLLGMVPEWGLPFNLAAAAIEFARDDPRAGLVSLAAAGADLVGLALGVRAAREGATVAMDAGAGAAPAGAAARLVRDGWRYADLPPIVLGETLDDGTVLIRRGLTGRDLEQTLRHEAIHSWLRLPVVRIAVVRLYRTSQLWRYAEEMLAETYATGDVLRSVSFPLEGGYVQPVRLAGEAAAAPAAAGATAAGAAAAAMRSAPGPHHGRAGRGR
jgi:hypothetical protein